MAINEKQIAELILTSSPEGILIVDENGLIKMVNQSLIKMFGYYNEAELINQKMEILIPQSSRTKHHKYRSDFSKKPSKRQMGTNRVLHGLRKDKTEFAVEIGLNHIQTEEGLLISAMISDISERVEIQNKLTKLNEKLESIVEERTEELKNVVLELQDTNKDLENQYRLTKKAENEARIALEKEKELHELKSRFVSMASHEFRTPLSTVLSSNSLLKRYLEKESNVGSESKQKLDKHLNRIEYSVANLNEILEDLLPLGKLEEGKIIADYEIFSISELCNEINEELSSYLKKGQQLLININCEDKIKTDRHLLHNILLNLLSNASKYSNEGKAIQLNITDSENKLKIEVIDQGIGIPSEDIQYMFSRFFRAKNATNIQGTGLGLNIVKKYLELINGSINFTSELNVGTTFTVTLNN